MAVMPDTPSTSRNVRLLELGLPGQVPDPVVLGLLRAGEAESEQDRVLERFLGEVGNACEAGETDWRWVWPRLDQEIIDDWPSLTYHVLSSRHKCVFAGTGALGWVAPYFRAFEATGTSEHQVVLAARGGLSAIFSDNRVIRVKRSGSSLELLKAHLIAFLVACLREHVLLHAASLARGNRAILLVGPSMTGKTTLAMSCYVRGWGFMSEDLTAVHKVTGRLSSFPKSVSLRPQALELLREKEEIQSLLVQAELPGVIDPRRMKTAESAQARAVFLLRGRAERPLARPIDKGTLLKHLFFHLLARPPELASAAAGLEGLLAQAQGYELWLGSPDETAEMVCAIGAA
jgi:hypothetical protein